MYKNKSLFSREEVKKAGNLFILIIKTPYICKAHGREETLLANIMLLDINLCKKGDFAFKSKHSIHHLL